MPQGTIDLGTVTLNPVTRVVRGGRGKAPQQLSPREFALLMLLRDRGGEIVTTDSLVPALFAHKEALATALKELRRKLGDKPKDPRFVKTVRGRGLVYVGPPRPYDEPESLADVPRAGSTARGVLRHLPVGDDRLPRRAAVEKLKRALLATPDANGAFRPKTSLTALAGMSGIGKTVLASLLMDDAEVQARFADGILGLTIGRNPDPARLDAEIRAIPSALGDSPAGWTAATYRERLEAIVSRRSMLLVLDDVWDVRDIQTWRPVKLGTSALLMTTRHRNFAAAIPGLTVIEADFLTEEEALQLLAMRAGTAVHKLPKEARQVLAFCGHKNFAAQVPAFAVSIAGSMVSQTRDWPGLVALFKAARLDDIQTLIPREHERYETIFRWIHVSVDALPADIRDRYLACCVFKDDIVVSEADLRTIWDDETGLRVKSWLARLHGACLLNWDSTGAVTFHDLHMDYLRARATGINP